MLALGILFSLARVSSISAKGAAMNSARELELHDEAVKVTWCACERCSVIGPHSMTLVKHHHEEFFEFEQDCCSDDLEEVLVSGETLQRPLRNQIPR